MHKKCVRNVLIAAAVLLLIRLVYDVPGQVMLLFIGIAVAAQTLFWNEAQPAKDTTDKRPE